MTREDLRFRCAIPETVIQHKKVLASFRRGKNAPVESGIGEIMVTTNAAGMSLVWLQFRDDPAAEWVMIYLNEERVNLLRKVSNAEYDYVIAPTLDAGQELDARRRLSSDEDTTVQIGRSDKNITLRVDQESVL